METLKYITTTLTQFFKSLNIKTKENTANLDKFEFTQTKFGLHLYQNLDSNKESKSLLTQMYSEENETLFI